MRETLVAFAVVVGWRNAKQRDGEEEIPLKTTSTLARKIL